MKQLIDKWKAQAFEYEAEAEKAWEAEQIRIAQQYEQLAELCISHADELEDELNKK